MAVKGNAISAHSSTAAPAVARNVACLLLWLITCMLLRPSVSIQHILLLYRCFTSTSNFLKSDLIAYKDQLLPMHTKENVKPYSGIYHSISVNHDHIIPSLKTLKRAK